ncbi:MAG: hypothetical protein KF884_06450 [Fimbriimonadaceae bacterium]|nr:hypothetical protein [Fimbriimonadaceae bacterium]QYK57190.1 MAG: hypothetical protein KF884_06450 [Fimbriimonadaceae bacterium]
MKLRVHIIAIGAGALIGLAGCGGQSPMGESLGTGEARQEFSDADGLSQQEIQELRQIEADESDAPDEAPEALKPDTFRVTASGYGESQFYIGCNVRRDKNPARGYLVVRNRNKRDFDQVRFARADGNGYNRNLRLVVDGKKATVSGQGYVIVTVDNGRGFKTDRKIYGTFGAIEMQDLARKSRAGDRFKLMFRPNASDPNIEAANQMGWSSSSMNEIVTDRVVRGVGITVTKS